MSDKITSATIDNLLQDRHTHDVYVSQCKTGATWQSRFFKSQQQLLIFDGWAMKKKWAKPLVIGYEIKVARNDFMGDDKWQGYLPYCNQLYFVCPPNIIMPNELSPEVGLIYTSKTGTKLFEKKKAVHRDVQIPDSIFRYILMSRTKIVRDIYNQQSKEEFWREWINDKNSTRGFGAMVASSIRKEIEERVDRVEKKNRELETKIKKYESLNKIIELVNMNPDEILGWSFESNFRKKIEELKRGFPEGFDAHVESVIRHLQEVRKTIWGKNE